MVTLQQIADELQRIKQRREQLEKAMREIQSLASARCEIEREREARVGRLLDVTV